MLSPEVTQLFEQNGIEYIKELERSQREQVEQKQQQLRKLVGERYRDLLDSTTILVEMQRNSSQLLDILAQVKDHSQSAGRLRLSEVTEQGLNAERTRKVVIATNLHYVVSSHDALWSLLDEQKFFAATQRYVEATRLVREMTASEDLSLLGPHGALVAGQSVALARFPSIITRASSEWLLRSTLTGDECAGALCSLVVLDRQPPARILQMFLERRACVVEANLDPRGAGRPGEKLCAVADSIKQTLSHVHELFGAEKPLFLQYLALLNEGGGSVEEETLEAPVIREASARWMADMARQVLERGAPLLDNEEMTGDELKAVRQQIWERTGDSAQLWDAVFRPTLLEAGKRLVSRLWSDEPPRVLSEEDDAAAEEEEQDGSMAARVWSGGPPERLDVLDALQRLERLVSARASELEWLALFEDDARELRFHLHSQFASWMARLVRRAQHCSHSLSWARLCRALAASSQVAALFSSGGHQGALDAARSARGLSSRTEALLARYTSKRAHAQQSAACSEQLVSLRGLLHAQDVRLHTLWCQTAARDLESALTAELQLEFRARPERASGWHLLEEQALRVPRHPSAQLYAFLTGAAGAVNRTGAFSFQPAVLRCFSRLLGGAALRAYASLKALDGPASIQVMCDLLVLRETLREGSTANEDVMEALGGTGDSSDSAALSQWYAEVDARLAAVKASLDSIDVAFYQPYLEGVVSAFLARCHLLLHPLAPSRGLPGAADSDWDENTSSLAFAPTVYPFRLLPLGDTGTKTPSKKKKASHIASIPNAEFKIAKKKSGLLGNLAELAGSGFFK